MRCLVNPKVSFSLTAYYLLGTRAFRILMGRLDNVCDAAVTLGRYRRNGIGLVYSPS